MKNFICIVCLLLVMIITNNEYIPINNNYLLNSTRFNNIHVTYTLYYPSAGRSTPSYKTASGLHINDKIAITKNIVAVSHDIKNKLNLMYGDTLHIKFNSSQVEYKKYIFHDVMNRKWENKIDILVPSSQKKLRRGHAKIVNVYRLKV